MWNLHLRQSNKVHCVPGPPGHLRIYIIIVAAVGVQNPVARIPFKDCDDRTENSSPLGVCVLIPIFVVLGKLDINVD